MQVCKFSLLRPPNKSKNVKISILWALCCFLHLFCCVRRFATVPSAFCQQRALYVREQSSTWPPTRLEPESVFDGGWSVLNVQRDFKKHAAGTLTDIKMGKSKTTKFKRPQFNSVGLPAVVVKEADLEEEELGDESCPAAELLEKVWTHSQLDFSPKLLFLSCWLIILYIFFPQYFNE